MRGGEGEREGERTNRKRETDGERRLTRSGVAHGGESNAEKALHNLAPDRTKTERLPGGRHCPTQHQTVVAIFLHTA